MDKSSLYLEKKASQQPAIKLLQAMGLPLTSPPPSVRRSGAAAILCSSGTSSAGSCGG